MSQMEDFETDLKLVIRKHYRRGNEAMPLEGGTPSDYGQLDDEDMGAILAAAAKVLTGENPTSCAGDYLYHHSPLPKSLTKKEAAEWLKILME